MARAKRAAGRRSLHFDCFSGASGNMLLGALLEVGASARTVRTELAELPIQGLRLRTSRVERHGLGATYVRFDSREPETTHRSYRNIRGILARAKLSRAVKERSQRVFHALASVEAKIHGCSIDEVHFHELGAVDTLGDVIGVCAAVESLDVRRITCSPIAIGHGTVETAHGQLPLPAPATLALLRGVPTYPAQVAWETITPTGAALLANLVDEYGPMPACTPAAQGFGAGNDRHGPMPNVLRAVLGELESGITSDMVAVIETNLDDMSPEALAFLAERLIEEGALDVSLSPLSMKKGRPGQLLRVLTRPSERDAIARKILLESSAIGVRSTLMPRLVLAREQRQVRTRFGRIGMKVVQDPRGKSRATPEYEDCARAARRHKVPLLDVYRSAERAAVEQLA
jgi:pyridinium-3,5-bisthiocarboxylic acid mononucleotide nickel chelatase